jgi:isopentenyl diphosphate isomerase/L-lactate dehydrogenase-like FMN-dependent dehydrogenase
MNDKIVANPGGSEFGSLHEIIRKGRQNLTQNAWDTLVGGTETEMTLRRNRLALDSIGFRPRAMRDVSRVDASVEQFGRRLRLPLFLAPTGPLILFGAGGGATVVAAARAFGIGHMLSSGCTPLATVAGAAPDALRMAQLYVRGDDTFVHNYIARVIACGCVAICLPLMRPFRAGASGISPSAIAWAGSANGRARNSRRG